MHRFASHWWQLGGHEYSTICPGAGCGERRHHLAGAAGERDFLIDNLLVRIHYIIVMIKWTGLVPWEVLQVTLPSSPFSLLSELGTCLRILR